MRLRDSTCWVLVVVAACSEDPSGHSIVGPPMMSAELGAKRGDALADSNLAQSVLQSLRLQSAMIPQGVVERFEALGDGRLAAVSPPAQRGQATRPARVILPDRASGFVDVEDPESRIGVAFTLDGASDARLLVSDGAGVYVNALGRAADLVRFAYREGVEDFVAFAEKPPREALELHVDVSRVAGLRLVADTLEMLDGRGTPRLRMARPYLVDATGDRYPARVDVMGCGLSTDPRTPWDRPVTAPGARLCSVVVTWGGQGLRYPAILDPAWTTTGSMSVPRTGHTASVLLDGRVFVVGGETGAFSTETYDPETATWAQTAPAAWSTHYDHRASVLQSGKVLVRWFSILNHLYDPATGVWTAAGPMVVSRSHHTQTVLPSGKVLAAGGYGGGDGISSAELYDPVTNTWTSTSGMANKRGQHTATLLQSGKVLVAAGSGDPVGVTPTASSELYDPTTEGWTATGNLNQARHQHTAVLLPDGRVLVVGGGWAAATEIYDPQTGGWSIKGSPQSRVGHETVLLPGGNVLVASGTGTKSAAVYDLPLGDWVPISSLQYNHDFGTGSVLQNGSVLVAGGENYTVGETSATSAVELLNPSNGVPCTLSVECASGVCFEGMCCDEPCSALCHACSAAKKGYGPDGICAPIAVGLDPDGDCADQGGASCATNGSCDGAGSCALYAAGTPCGSASCADDFLTEPECNGSGVCTETLESCAPYGCLDATACAASCASDDDCAATGFCDIPVCKMKGSPGAPCTASNECSTGLCIDGFCCSSLCPGQCEACDVSGAEGACAPVVGAPHGARPACPAANAGQPCSQRSCDGIERTACDGFVGSAVACRPASCDDGVATLAANCDGKGQCPAEQTKTCEPYTCGGDACNDSCRVDGECAAGNQCDLATSKCVS